MNKRIKRVMSVTLAFVIMCFSVLPCLAAVTYPENVTKDQVLSTIEKADKAVDGFMKTQNTSLMAILEKELYSDKVLSMILTELYKAMELEAGDALSAVDINISVKGLAKELGRYPEVAQKLSAYSSWAEVDLTGASWNVSNKSEFSIAVASMLSPFDDILYALLCSGSYSLNLLVGIKGSNGYETAIIPTFEAMGCRDYLGPEEFYAQAEEDRGSMIYNIAYDLVSFIEEAAKTPCDTFSSIIPSIANYFVGGGFDNAVATLMAPLRLEVLNISTVVRIEALTSFISDTESFTQNFTLNINDMLAQTGIPMAPIDLPLLASLGTVNPDGSVTADKADTFIVLLRWIIDTLKLNQANIPQLLPDADPELMNMLSGVFTKDTDSLISLIVSLFNQTGPVINDSQWSFPQFTPGQVTYTPNLTAEKYQRVADGVDDLLDEFVAEMGEEKSLSAIIKKELYSSKTLSMIFVTLFGALETEELSAVSSMLGFDFSPKGIADVLGRKGFSAAAKNLRAYKKWSSIGENGIDLGIKTGSEKQFVSVMASAFSPLNELLGMLLAEDKFILFDAVEIYGSNGYNTAIIPLYEAFGCEPSTIRTHEEFKALYNKGKGIEALLDPIVTLMNRIIERPVYTVLEIMPNLFYFLQSGGIKLCLDNLIYPFKGILAQLGMENAIDLSAMASLDLNSIATELLSSLELGITLPAFDISTFASYGTPVEKQSKRLVSGQYATVTYIQSDMPAICVSLLRIMAQTIKDPANASLIDTLMETGSDVMGDTQLPEGTEGIVDSFIQSVVNDINAMTVDEAAEWIYKLFFRERATVDEPDEEEYLPTIIYKPKMNYTAILLVLFGLMLIPVGIIVRNKLRLKRMKENFEEYSATLTRTLIQNQSVEHKMLDDKVGYIKVTGFEDTTVGQFEEAFLGLTEQKMESLIVDLRGNPGGNLSVVVEMCDMLLPEGTIVSIEDRNGKGEVFTSDAEHKLNVPLVVLINGNSASASEIFAGAVKDYGMGTLVGTTTFGKGIVQNIIRLSNGDAMKITTAKYFTPKGNDIHKVGVKPDVEVEYEYSGSLDESYDKQYDSQFLKAVEIMKEKLANQK